MSILITNKAGTATATVPNSFVYLQAPNGHGSSNTTVRRWSTTIASVGSDITYADSATLGGSFTINTTGIYSMSWNDQNSGASEYFGFTINSVQLSTSILSVTTTNTLMVGQSAANISGLISVTARLSSGDVIRGQDEGGLNYTNNAGRFRITRVL